MGHIDIQAYWFNAALGKQHDNTFEQTSKSTCAKLGENWPNGSEKNLSLLLMYLRGCCVISC